MPIVAGADAQPALAQAVARESFSSQVASWDIEAWEAVGVISAEQLAEIAQLTEEHEPREFARWLDAVAERHSLGTVLALLSLADAAQLARAVGWQGGPWALPASWTDSIDSLRVTNVAARSKPRGSAVRLDGVLPAVACGASLRELLLPLADQRLARVNLAAQGVTSSSAQQLGLHAAGLRRIELSNVIVDASCIAQLEAQRVDRLQTQHRLLAAGALITWCRELIATTFAFIGRRPFQDSVLATLQVVRHRTADLDAQWRALAAQHKAAESAGLERGLHASLLTEHLHHSVLQLVKTCQQLHGGRGFLCEHWVSRAYRDARCLERLLGSRRTARREILARAGAAPRSLALATTCNPPAARDAARDPELSVFRKRARDFIAQRVAALTARWEQERGDVAALHRLFAAERLTTAALARSDGGLGADFRFTVALIEELMTGASPSVAVSLMLAAGTVFPLIAEHAQGRLRARLLPEIAAGKAIFAFGITEPDGGSDLLHATRTTGRFEGDEIVLDGKKMFVTNAPIADYVLALVRTSQVRGPLQASLVVVPTSTAGVSVSEPYDTLGLRGSPTGAVEFHDVRLPKDHLIGRAGLGFHLLAEAAIYERVLIAAGSIALAETCVRSTLAATLLQPQARVSAHLDALSCQLARLEGQRALIEQILAASCCGRSDRNDAALLKFSACEVAQDAIECAADAAAEHADAGLALQMQGRLRDCRIFSVFAGASEMMRDAYSAGLLPRIRLGAWGYDD
jgi:alkylation response protein AidB-like acyl-CoA dehydrogenase